MHGGFQWNIRNNEHKDIQSLYLSLLRIHIYEIWEQTYKLSPDKHYVTGGTLVLRVGTMKSADYLAFFTLNMIQALFSGCPFE